MTSRFKNFFLGKKEPETTGSPQYKAAIAKRLDMATDARLARAEKMGFNTKKIWYHGTQHSFDSFDPSKSLDRLGIHVGTVNQASGFAYSYALDDPGYNKEFKSNRQILPVFTRVKNPVRLPDLDDWWPSRVYSALVNAGVNIHKKDSFTPEDIVRALKELGYDGIIYQNDFEGRNDGGGDQEDSLIVFDPENIRSIYAAFDPDKSASSNLLESSAAEWIAKKWPFEETSKFYDTIGSYTDADGYTSLVVPFDKKMLNGDQNLGRSGLIYIRSPEGETRWGFYWMDFPENNYEGYGSELADDFWDHLDRGTPYLSAWKQMPIQDRLNIEAKHQATAYEPLKQQFNERPFVRMDDHKDAAVRESRKKPFSQFLVEASNRDRAEKYRDACLKRLATDTGFMPEGSIIQKAYYAARTTPSSPNYSENTANAWVWFLNWLDGEVGEKYLLWAVKQYASGSIRLIEDIPSKLADRLKEYQGYINKNNAPLKDDARALFADGSLVTKANWKSIDTFKTYNDFEFFMLAMAALSKPEVEAESKTLKRLAKSGGVEIIYQNGENEFVIRLKSFEASKELFKDKTQWCTARSANLYQQYSQDTPLVVMKYGHNKYWQYASYGTSIELLDQDDSVVGLRNWASLIDTPLAKAFMGSIKRPAVVRFLKLNRFETNEQTIEFTKEDVDFLAIEAPSFFLSYAVAWNAVVMDYVFFSGNGSVSTIMDRISSQFNGPERQAALKKIGRNTIERRDSILPNLLFSYLTEYEVALSEEEALDIIIELDDDMERFSDAQRLKFRDAARGGKLTPPSEAIRALDIMYGPKVAMPLARRGYFGDKIKKYALSVKEKTKPRLSDLITERADQATTLLMKLTRNAIKTSEALVAELERLGFMLGAGGNSNVYYGSQGGNWVCKVSQFTQGDSAFRFLKKVFEQKLWKTNPLFPRVMGVGQLEDGYMWAILERVNPLNIQVWYEITGSVARVGTKPVFNNYFDALASNQQPVPTTQRMINQFCDAFEINEDDLKDFLVTTMRTSGSPVLDIRMANMGLRDNGTLCIYDPVT